MKARQEDVINKLEGALYEDLETTLGIFKIMARICKVLSPQMLIFHAMILHDDIRFCFSSKKHTWTK